MNDLISYFPFLAGLGGFVMLWSQIKGLLKKIFNLFVIEIEVSGNSETILYYYLSKKAKLFSLGKRIYIAMEEYVKPEQKHLFIGKSLLSDEPCLYLLNNKPIIFFKKKGNDGNCAKCFFFRFTFDSQKLMIDALDYFNLYVKQQNKRFFIRHYYGLDKKRVFSKLSEIPQDPIVCSSQSLCEDGPNLLKWEYKDLGYGNKDKIETLNGVVLTQELKDLKTYVERWIQSENWYKRKGLVWRLGILLFGTPGSGKTFGILKIAQSLDIPIYIFDLGSLSNQELIEFWKKMKEEAPRCIALFEDIDTIWDKRKNINKEVGPTFDCFLNCLSGAIPSEGVFTVITTNKIDCIDEALGIPTEKGSSRPGRLDNCIKLNGFSREDRLELAKIILEDYQEYIKDMVDKTEGMTVAQCSNEFSKLALELYWKNK